jgi:hypothetical protein
MASTSWSMLDGLPRDVAAVLRRHLFAAVAPAAVLGAGADALVLARHHLEAEIALALAVAIGFELYVGYAELIVAADRARPRERPRIGTLLRRALPLTPPLAAASVAAVTLPLAAAGLLVLPGLWLLTRWSLFAPAIVHERLGPVAALRRSTALVRGAFWPVACTVSASVLVEHAVIHGTVHEAQPAHGAAIGLAAAALATLVVSPPAAFTVSLVYERLAQARDGDPRAGLPRQTGAPPSVAAATPAGSR